MFDSLRPVQGSEKTPVASAPEWFDGGLRRPQRLWSEVLADMLDKPALLGCESLGVCPASSRQGAAYLTAALGEWSAQHSDSPVLLVEANLRHPQLPALLGTEPGPGLVEALYDGLDAEEVIHSTSIPLLNVMPAGRPLNERGQRQELGARFRPFFRRLRQRFPNTIIDLPAADDADYATFPFDVPDAIVLAVAPHLTRVNEIQNAGRRLAAVGSNVVAAMLNEERN